jgi:heme/copper-type cytochrome/quinol oxidase subunit 2
MEWAALITWVATAGFGFALLLIWVARGGMTQAVGIRPFLITGHFLLAATGLAIWIAYLATDNDTLAWIAFVILAVVALLGWTMFAIWYQRRRSRGAVTEAVDPSTPAEQHFPVSVIAVHGVLAVTTVLLVLLTALEVGS